MKWITKEKTRKHIIVKQMEHIPPCPCSGFQAMFSPTHASIPGTDCFVSVQNGINADHSSHIGMVRI